MLYSVGHETTPGPEVDQPQHFKCYVRGEIRYRRMLHQFDALRLAIKQAYGVFARVANVKPPHNIGEVTVTLEIGGSF